MLEDISFNRENMLLELMAKTTSRIDLESVLDDVVQDAPKIVGAIDCYIFLQPQYVSKTSEVLGRKKATIESVFGKNNADVLVLAATNQEHQKSQIGNVYFEAGEGVTGWVYRNSKTLLLHDVSDVEELWRISPELSWVNKLDRNKSSGNAHSILALPLISESVTLGTLELHGALNNSMFTDLSEKSAFIIAGFSASVISNLYTNENRKHFLISLAHEINTPLTAILADAENLSQELPSNSEFHQTANHIFGQVLRLHMQTATLMSVLSEQTITRQFSEHSVYRPLKEACELFESEALQKGLEILGPRARDGVFPNIEMSLFDLTIAFKNIIHNAVKYSYAPPKNMDIHRVIKVWGQWDSNREGYYSIFVQNYGVGIMPFEIEKRLIFEPYYRGERSSDRRRTGAGFGLAYARSVIEDLHHGQISVTSNPQGSDAFLTTFSISLPVKQPK